MVRSLCCEKMGLKKGPWTAEEDQALVSYIQQNGHGNWRALPKQAGLLRCGKSCRLRWINYLRPDIKRGNFSKEEEDTIFQLHERLGNRWSAIAARLPGRTDNEIKNVWHTNLKKKLKHYQSTQCDSNAPTQIKSENPEFSAPPGNNNPGYESVSPQRSSSELSSVTDSSAMTSTVVIKQEKLHLSDNKFPEIDESFWSEELQAEDSRIKNSEFWRFNEGLEFQMVNNSGTVDDDDDGGMDFWYNLFTRGADVPELPEF